MGLDVTPLFDHPTGVTRFVSGLLHGLRADESINVGGWIISARPIDRALPAAADMPDPTVRIRTPARLVHRAWANGVRLGSRQFNHFEVVHGTNFAAPPGLKSVLSLHDLTLFESSNDSGTNTGRAGVVHRAIAEGSHLLVPTQHVRRLAIDMLDADPQRVTVVTYGLTPIPVTEPGAGLRRVAMSAYVLALGTVNHRKNLVPLIRAMDAMPPEIGLVLAGAIGDDEGAVRDSITKIERRRAVRRLTNVDDIARAELLRDASLLAYPSLDEGFGFPPLEAMSVGVPVVAADAGSIPEVVGDAALLVDPSDPASIAEAMTNALEPDTISALTAKGFEVAARFNWSAAAAETAAVYRRVAEGE